MDYLTVVNVRIYPNFLSLQNQLRFIKFIYLYNIMMETYGKKSLKDNLKSYFVSTSYIKKDSNFS